MQKISKKLKVILGARKTPYAIEKNSLNKIILVKSPKRIKTNSIVFRDQFNYGHREILLDYLGLSDRIHHKPNELSGGEQQRVSVARALINKPNVIFADEPSGNLDTASAENLHQLFFKLRDEFGQTFVIVTHNEVFANMADRKLVMVDGLISNK